MVNTEIDIYSYFSFSDNAPKCDMIMKKKKISTIAVLGSRDSLKAIVKSISTTRILYPDSIIRVLTNNTDLYDQATMNKPRDNNPNWALYDDENRDGSIAWRFVSYKESTTYSN